MKINNKLKALGCSSLLAMFLLSPGQTQAQNWQLVWSDEFNGSIGPDWSFATGNGTSGWGNNEEEYYQQQNATIVNVAGVTALAITAKNESVGGYNYTSARMSTQGHQAWLYGQIVASISLPAFQGSWPAFWMLGSNIGSVGWPQCGELDIMEQINTAQTVNGSTHWYTTQQADFTGSTGVAVTGFHQYSITWDNQYIKWFVDGAQYNQFYIGGNAGGTTAFNQNTFFILLNMAVGGNWPGFSVNNGALPASMYVDYVRVYQNAPPPPQSNGLTPYFEIVNKGSGKVLDLNSGNPADGTKLQQWAPLGGINQLWYVLPTENANHFKIISAASGKCESINGDSKNAGALVQEWEYVGGDAGQQFDLVDAGNGWFNIVNVNSGLVMDVQNGSTANGAQVQQWTYNGTGAQLWRLQPVGNYYIRGNTGLYVVCNGRGTADGTAVVTYSWEANPWYQWNFSSVSDGWYSIFSLYSNRLICLLNESSSPGDPLVLWDYDPYNTGGQRIRLEPETNGTYKFYFKLDGQCWDIPNDSGAENTPLQQWNDVGSPQQTFNLERVPGT
jgi:beta-glucanase (GH16 family)